MSNNVGMNSVYKISSIGGSCHYMAPRTYCYPLVKDPTFCGNIIRFYE